MTAANVELKRHLNAYHRSAPLLLQFTLSEFILLFQQFQAIKTLIEEEQFNHTLYALLARFSGSQPERRKIFHSHSDNGGLARLCMYATLLSDHIEMITKDFTPLEKCTRRCWLLGSHLKEAVEEQNIATITLYVEKVQRCLKVIIKEILKTAVTFKDNENVLYFLVRHKTQIDAALGVNCIVRLLKSLFPRGLSEARHYIITKYLNRGFDKLPETINHYFDQI